MNLEKRISHALREKRRRLAITNPLLACNTNEPFINSKTNEKWVEAIVAGLDGDKTPGIELKNY